MHFGIGRPIPQERSLLRLRFCSCCVPEVRLRLWNLASCSVGRKIKSECRTAGLVLLGEGHLWRAAAPSPYGHHVQQHV